MLKSIYLFQEVNHHLKCNEPFLKKDTHQIRTFGLIKGIFMWIFQRASLFKTQDKIWFVKKSSFQKFKKDIEAQAGKSDTQIDNILSSLKLKSEEHGLELHKNSDALAHKQEYLASAKQLFDQGEVDQAIETLKKLRTHFPACHELLFTQAEVYCLKGEIETVKKIFNVIKNEDNTKNEIFTYFIEKSIQEKNFTAALKILPELKTRQTHYRLLLAKAFFEYQQIDTALKILDEVPTGEFENFTRDEAIKFFNVQDFEVGDSIARYRRPEDKIKEFYDCLAQHMINIHRYEDLNLIAEKTSHPSEIYGIVFKYYVKNGQLEKAEKYLDGKLFIEKIELYADLADEHYKKGNWDQALDIIANAVALKDVARLKAFLLKLADQFEQRDQLDKAIECLSYMINNNKIVDDNKVRKLNQIVNSRNYYKLRNYFTTH